MRRTPTFFRAPFALALVTATAACGTQSGFDVVRTDATNTDVNRDGSTADGDDADTSTIRDVQPIDVSTDSQLNPDASCATATAAATVESLPVDIIWVVDNSSSMAPAIDQVIQGLNGFASLISSRGFDYHVVMLSLRNVDRNAVTGRYAVCIPPPLAGDSTCGNGPRFFHSNVQIYSTQPLDQLLGTLGQTTGYSMGEMRGGEPWRQFLRPNATKTIVVVTDDNSRLSANNFLHFRGGPNPMNGNLILPPGILDSSWGGLFDNYTFNGIYGWGDPTDPSVTCRFPGGATPSSPGPVYTTLVNGSMGERAQICDGASAWTPFFQSVASTVERTSRVACDVAIPTPPDGSVLDPTRVNVVFNGATTTTLGKVANAAACGANGGWYYDNDTTPMRVILCPASCDRAQTELRGTGRGLNVQFGCVSIPG